MTANADQIAYWNGKTGAKWAANQQRLDAMMAPLTDALLEAARVETGASVVDVGCGCGDLALRLAESAGRNGKVLALDISEPMVARGQERAQALGAGDHAAIDWRVADAMTCEFQADHDLLVSRFGVMFFDNMQRAFGNLRAALRPNGRFAFLTWRRRRDVEWMQAPLDWVAPVLPSPEASDGSIGPFALCDPDATCELFRSSGFRDVSCEPVDRLMTIGSDADEAFKLLTETGPAARVVGEAEDEQRRRAKELMRQRIDELAQGGPVRMNGACWLYQSSA